MGYGTGSQKFPIAHDFLVLLERNNRNKKLLKIYGSNTTLSRLNHKIYSYLITFIHQNKINLKNMYQTQNKLYYLSLF